MFLIVLILLVSCEAFPAELPGMETPSATEAVSMQAIVQSSTPLPPSPTNTASPTIAPTQEPFLQLTYMLQELNDRVGFYAVTLGCPNEIPPCLSEPELLFTIESINDPSFTEHSWSSDGSRIVFSLNAVGWGSSLYLADSSGESITVLIDAKEEGPVHNPDWSGSGNEIAYYSCEETSCSIMIWDLEKSEQLPFFSNDEFQWSFDPSWSSDGSFMVFSAVESSGVRQQLFFSDATGSQVTQVTMGSGNKLLPALSPHGDKIIFIRYPTDWDGKGKLMITDASGINEVVLLSEWLTDYSGPVWSQVGDWIAFNKMFDIDGWDVFISKPDGTNVIQITNSPDISKSLPSWRYVH